MMTTDKKIIRARVGLLELSPKEQAMLARVAEGIDRRTLDQIAAFGADEILPSDQERPNRGV